MSIGRLLEEILQGEEYSMIRGQKLVHKKKTSWLPCLSMKKPMYEILARGGLLPSACAAVRNKDHHNSPAGPALEADSSSMVEMDDGFRAGGLRWFIAVRAVLLYMLSRKPKSSWSSKSKQDRNGMSIPRRACKSKALCGCEVYLAGSHRVSACHQQVGPYLGWALEWWPCVVLWVDMRNWDPVVLLIVPRY